MSEDLREFVSTHTAQVRELEYQINLAVWEGAVTGNPEAHRREAELRQQWMQVYADPEAYRRVKAWDEASAAGNDELLARQLRLLRLTYEKHQMDRETIARIAELERQATEIYTTFRGEIEGRKVSDNEIEQILQNETDSEKRRKAWEASKQIGPQIADTVRELARLRNRGARAMGYRNFHSMALTLDEIDEGELFKLLDELYQLTVEPFAAEKAALDERLAERYGVPVDEIQPWHYADPFFQSAPQTGDSAFDQYFEGRDLEALAVRTYDGLGLDVRDILERSDLYARENKYQHAFCIHMDREGDVRTICNLIPNLRWASTLLHELGHGVFDKYTDYALPWLLRGPNHTLTTEAMAILAGRFTLDEAWLTGILGLDEATVQDILPNARAYRRLGQMIFARWVMVIVNFERALYDDPEQDLDTLWWELVEKYQLVRKPEGRQAPDWATKIHIALYPAYYQNYLLGELMSWQWADRLLSECGGIVGRKEAGAWLVENVFKRANREDWNTALQIATGERLNPRYYVEQMLT